MKFKFMKFLLMIFFITTVILSVSCKSTPPAVEEPKVVDPGKLPPGQDALNEMNAAMARAESARETALAVLAQIYSPDEWDKAETDYNNAMNSEKSTHATVKQAAGWFTFAAVNYESAAENSKPLFEKDLEEASAALNTAKSRADQTRMDAETNNGAVYFPNDWNEAEEKYQSAASAPINTPDEMKSAAALYVSAADGFNNIAVKSRPLAAKEKDEANKQMQAASARAVKSKQAAAAVNGQTYFPDDWKNAEEKNTSAANAAKNTPIEIKAAAAFYTAAADAFDAIAKNAGPKFAKDKDEANKAAQREKEEANKAAQRDKDEANKQLQTAIARTEKSRQAVMDVDGQTYFPNEWKNAEAKNASAKNAKKTTTDEIKAAATLYGSAADAYDAITKSAGPKFAKEKDEATKAMNTASARVDKSRKSAADAGVQDAFPNEWKNAEAKSQAAKNAKRSTPAEIKAAAALYAAAADAYDEIVNKNTEQVVQTARTRADRGRQTALDLKADVAVKDEYIKAEATYQQALKDAGSRSFNQATSRYNQSADQFTAVIKKAEEKRNSAGNAIERAKQKSEESAAFAVNTGIAMEEEK